jgi:integration host factor subunit alpha
MTLKKTDLADTIYGKLGIHKKESLHLVESIIDIIKSELGKGNPVKISGFGKWTVKAKKERTGRNPKTGEEMAIRARKVVTFKPSLILKDALND